MLLANMIQSGYSIINMIGVVKIIAPVEDPQIA
jgi:hypothetical protein